MFDELQKEQDRIMWSEYFKKNPMTDEEVNRLMLGYVLFTFLAYGLLIALALVACIIYYIIGML